MDIIERVDIPYPYIKQEDIYSTTPSSNHYTIALKKQLTSAPPTTVHDDAVSAAAADPASTTCNAKPSMTAKTDRDHIMISNHNKAPAKKTSRHLWTSDDKHPEAIAPRQFETWIRTHRYPFTSATSVALPSSSVAEKSVVRKRSILSLFSYSSSSASGTTVIGDGVNSKDEEDEEEAISDSSSSRSTSSEEDEPPTPTNYDIFPAGFDATTKSAKESNFDLLSDEDRKAMLLQYTYLLANDQQKELQQQLSSYQQKSAKTEQNALTIVPTVGSKGAAPAYPSTDAIDTTSTLALEQLKPPISPHVDPYITTTTMNRNSELKRKSSTTSTNSSFSLSSTSSRRSWFSGLLEKSTKQKKRFSELFSLKKKSKRASTTAISDHAISSPTTTTTVERCNTEARKDNTTYKYSTCLTNNDFINDTSTSPTRYPPNTERAIYRLSHLKLGNARRPLHQQVVISNFMYRYLSILQQQHEKQKPSFYSTTNSTTTTSNYNNTTMPCNTDYTPIYNTHTNNNAIYYHQQQPQQVLLRQRYSQQNDSSSSRQQTIYSSSTIKTNIYKATCSAFEPPAPGHHQHQPKQQRQNNSVFVSKSASSPTSSNSTRRRSLLLLPRKSSLVTSSAVPQLDQDHTSFVVEKEQKRQSNKDKYKPIRNSQFMMMDKRMVQSVN